MEPASVFLLLLVLAFIVLFVTRPFFQRRRVRTEKNNQELSTMLAERDQLLTALQELDFDQSLGKIPADDYPAQRTVLLKKGAEVLRRLDTLSPLTAKQAGRKVQVSDSNPKPSAPLSDDDLEDLLAKRRNSRKGKTAGFCAKCGKPVLQTDVFCPSCGTTLK